MSGLQLALLTLTSELAAVVSQCPSETLQCDLYIEYMWRGLSKPKLNEPKNWSKLRSCVLSLNATISSSKSAKPVQRLSTASKATRKSSWASGQNDNPTVGHFQLIGHSAKLPVVMCCIFTAHIYSYLFHWWHLLCDLHRFQVYPIIWLPVFSSIFVTPTRLCTCVLIPRPALISVCARHGLKEFFCSEWQGKAMVLDAGFEGPGTCA